MKRIYEVAVYFDYPPSLWGERRTTKYLVEAGTVLAAARLGQRLARRDRNGGYAPRIERIEAQGTIDAR